MKNVKRVVDVIAEYEEKFVLIERLSFPTGLALPGGHIEGSERPIDCARREFSEETGLTLSRVRFICRSQGKLRDPRGPSVSRVYRGVASGVIRNETGKTKVLILSRAEVLSMEKARFAFDHHAILWRVLEA